MNLASMLYLNNILYLLTILVWVSVAVVFIVNRNETPYSKWLVVLATANITVLAIGNMI